MTIAPFTEIFSSRIFLYYIVAEKEHNYIVSNSDHVEIKTTMIQQFILFHFAIVSVYLASYFFFFLTRKRMFKSPISLGLSSLLGLGLCTLVCKHTSLSNYRKSPVLQEVSDVAEQSSAFLMLSFWSYVSFTIYLVHFLSSWPIEKTEKIQT